MYQNNIFITFLKFIFNFRTLKRFKNIKKNNLKLRNFQIFLKIQPHRNAKQG